MIIIAIIVINNKGCSNNVLYLYVYRSVLYIFTMQIYSQILTMFLYTMLKCLAVAKSRLRAAKITHD